MPRFATPVLLHVLEALPHLLPELPDPAALAEDALVALYERVVAQVETRMWEAGETDFVCWLERYQALFREQQALIDSSGALRQYAFILGIPVADRPAHVRNCLESILQQCRLYGYGGQDAAGRYAKFTVVLSEDSRDPLCAAAHRALAAEYSDKGLSVLHFDLPEQVALLQGIPATERQQLGRLLTTQPPERFWRKGQAANRNLCILKMRELARDPDNTLFYLVDSDQSFLVNRPGGPGEQAVPALNYFHTIDRLFRMQDIRVLTGKLVGDPPVSPAVMAANFLDDALAFLHRIEALDPHAACSFHGQATPLPGEAAYHDLAKLFGFEQAAQAFDYRCPLAGPHDHAACLDTFAARLRAFFFGEHPTRRTGFQYTGPLTTLSPARTIYPGNTIVSFEGLKYIIPFGHLRLRMSGPTAGRLIQAEIGARFASVNLPMLHTRTTADDMRAEFRPGVEQRDDAAIDISDEFERQFFGDLMLFSVVAWLKRHDLEGLVDSPAVAAVVRQTETELLALYANKHAAVQDRLAELEAWLAAASPARLGAAARAQLQGFLLNMQANFGDAAPAWQQIQSEAHRATRRGQIVDALAHYRAERTVWDRLVS
ncbi:MAG: hypothetical protein AB1593_04320 [Pseudomonadota bacterium]